jgi:hypothetical protein
MAYPYLIALLTEPAGLLPTAKRSVGKHLACLPNCPAGFE